MASIGVAPSVRTSLSRIYNPSRLYDTVARMQSQSPTAVPNPYTATDYGNQLSRAGQSVGAVVQGMGSFLDTVTKSGPSSTDPAMGWIEQQRPMVTGYPDYARYNVNPQTTTSESGRFFGGVRLPVPNAGVNTEMGYQEQKLFDENMPADPNAEQVIQNQLDTLWFLRDSDIAAMEEALQMGEDEIADEYGRRIAEYDRQIGDLQRSNAAYQQSVKARQQRLDWRQGQMAGLPPPDDTRIEQDTAQARVDVSTAYGEGVEMMNDTLDTIGADNPALAGQLASEITAFQGMIDEALTENLENRKQLRAAADTYTKAVEKSLWANDRKNAAFEASLIGKEIQKQIDARVRQKEQAARDRDKAIGNLRSDFYKQVGTTDIPDQQTLFSMGLNEWAKSYGWNDLETQEYVGSFNTLLENGLYTRKDAEQWIAQDYLQQAEEMLATAWGGGPDGAKMAQIALNTVLGSEGDAKAKAQRLSSLKASGYLPAEVFQALQNSGLLGRVPTPEEVAAMQSSAWQQGVPAGMYDTAVGSEYMKSAQVLGQLDPFNLAAFDQELGLYDLWNESREVWDQNQTSNQVDAYQSVNRQTIYDSSVLTPVKDARGGVYRLAAPAATGWANLILAAGAAGVDLNIAESWRDPKKADEAYAKFQRTYDPVKQMGLNLNDKWVANILPGNKTEHAKGFAVDLAMTSDIAAGKKTPAYKWLTTKGPDGKTNAERYGWKNTNKREPWHWEYVGT